MKEKEFITFVKNLQDDQAMLPKASRDTVDQIIVKIKAKQTRMMTNKEWNVLSPEDTMIMALLNHIETQSSNNTTSKKKPKKKKDNATKNENADD